MNLTENLLLNLKTYTLTDYRRFLSAHLLFLSKLCQLSNQSVNYFINQFLSSLLITDQLLSKVAFERQIDLMLAQHEMNAPTILTRLLAMLRSTSHANAIVSTYGTNFDYYKLPVNGTWINLYSKAIVFDNNCSCGLDSTCTIPASYISKNGGERISLDGLKMGCTPSESFLASTLECFHHASCIHVILQMSNENSTIPSVHAPLALPVNTSRFSIHAKISDLLNDLFVEEWSIVRDYSSYYDECSPIQCSYKYHQQLDSLYTMTYLLSLYGGLTIIFKWICPRVIYVLVKVYGCCKKRTRSVSVAVIRTDETNIA